MFSHRHPHLHHQEGRNLITNDRYDFGELIFRRAGDPLAKEEPAWQRGWACKPLAKRSCAVSWICPICPTKSTKDGESKTQHIDNSRLAL